MKTIMKTKFNSKYDRFETKVKKIFMIGYGHTGHYATENRNYFLEKSEALEEYKKIKNTDRNGSAGYSPYSFCVEIGFDFPLSVLHSVEDYISSDEIDNSYSGNSAYEHDLRRCEASS